MARVRELTQTDDLAAVCQVYVRSWQHSYRGMLPQPFLDKLTVDRWLGMLRAEPGMSRGLFEDGRAAGTAMLGFCRETHREGFGEIVGLYLLPEYQGFGHGRSLLESAMERLLQEGCEQVCLWVFCGNTRAIGFYEHMGFQRTGRIQHEVLGGEAVAMEEMMRGL